MEYDGTSIIFRAPGRRDRPGPGDRLAPGHARAPGQLFQTYVYVWEAAGLPAATG